MEPNKLGGELVDSGGEAEERQSANVYDVFGNLSPTP